MSNQVTGAQSFEEERTTELWQRGNENEKQVEFPTSGNSSQFKIEGGMVHPLIANRNSHLSNAFNNSEENGTIRVQIFLNVEFEQGEKGELLKMIDEFPPTQMTIESMIQTAVMVFNEKLEIKNNPQRINPNFNIWNLYMSKKNGKPKQDLPALDRDNLLSESGAIDMFTLDTKHPDKLWAVTSPKWQAFMQTGEAPEEQISEKTTDSSTVSVNSSQMNTVKKTVTEAVKNEDLLSSVLRVKKPQRDTNAGCSGLCSFSKRK